MNIRILAKQFTKFGVVGAIGAIVDFGSYGILTRLLHWDRVLCLSLSDGRSALSSLDLPVTCEPSFTPIVFANLVSVFLAIISNFFLNKYWTFRDRQAGALAAQGVGYFVMSVMTWMLNQLLTGFFIAHLAALGTLFGSSRDIAAKALAIGVVLFFNFGGSKFFIFRGASSRSRITEATPSS